MEKFVHKHAQFITGTLSCFDRVIFKGHLRQINWPGGMERLIMRHGRLIKDFGEFVHQHSERLVLYAQQTAAKANRPYRFLRSSAETANKDEKAQAIAQRDHIREGLICVFVEQELCPSFTITWALNRPAIKANHRLCRCLYYYYMDPEFGLIHVRIQSWFPLNIQIAINAHSWLARQMTSRHIGFKQLENAFIQLDDLPRSQRLADQFISLPWSRRLDALARRVNPLLNNLLKSMHYYWTIDQAEYATDVMFRSQNDLRSLYPKLAEHALLCFTAENVLGFLGRRLVPQFQDEVLKTFKTRQEGLCLKHKIGKNGIKMYDKFGLLLRVETVINRPNGFRVRRRRISRKGMSVVDWFPMTKGIANMYRYAQISAAANSRYLDALAGVNDPAPAYRLLNACAAPLKIGCRSYRGFNPAAHEDVALFQAILRGEHAIQGFRNRDVRKRLYVAISDPKLLRHQSARVSRLLKRFHVRGLIAKIPHSRRWRVTDKGHQIMSIAIMLHLKYFPEAIAA
jgi:hypothetical protein